MRTQRVVASLASVVVLSITLLAIVTVWLYLTEYGRQRIVITIALAVLGAGLASLLYAAIAQLCRGDACAVVVGVLLGMALLAIIASPLYYGRITHARFGLTVYGLIPVPSLDITVGPRGKLWFRDKSHLLSLEEVQRLLAPQTEALIVGTGWEGQMLVDPAIRDLEGLEVRVLRTPAAFDLFNEYVSQGRKVALVAHSTC